MYIPFSSLKSWARNSHSQTKGRNNVKNYSQVQFGGDDSVLDQSCTLRPNTTNQLDTSIDTSLMNAHDRRNHSLGVSTNFKAQDRSYLMESRGRDLAETLVAYKPGTNYGQPVKENYNQFETQNQRPLSALETKNRKSSKAKFAHSKNQSQLYFVMGETIEKQLENAEIEKEKSRKRAASPMNSKPRGNESSFNVISGKESKPQLRKTMVKIQQSPNSNMKQLMQDTSSRADLNDKSHKSYGAYSTIFQNQKKSSKPQFNATQVQKQTIKNIFSAETPRKDENNNYQTNQEPQKPKPSFIPKTATKNQKSDPDLLESPSAFTQPEKIKQVGLSADRTRQVFEERAQKLEQLRLRAAQANLMYQNSKYKKEVEVNGCIVDKLTGDYNKQSHTLKKEYRDRCVTGAQQYALNPSTGERQAHIARLNQASDEGLVAQLTGCPIQHSHQKREGSRSASREQLKTFNRSGYDIEKQHLQNESDDIIFGHDSERRAVEKQKQLQQLSNYLKGQIAQKLKELDTNRQSELRLENSILKRETAHLNAVDFQESQIQAKILKERMDAYQLKQRKLDKQLGGVKSQSKISNQCSPGPRTPQNQNQSMFGRKRLQDQPSVVKGRKSPNRTPIKNEQQRRRDNQQVDETEVVTNSLNNTPVRTKYMNFGNNSRSVMKRKPNENIFGKDQQLRASQPRRDPTQQKRKVSDNVENMSQMPFKNKFSEKTK